MSVDGMPAIMCPMILPVNNRIHDGNDSMFPFSVIIMSMIDVNRIAIPMSS